MENGLIVKSEKFEVDLFSTSVSTLSENGAYTILYICMMKLYKIVKMNGEYLY